MPSILQLPPCNNDDTPFPGTLAPRTSQNPINKCTLQPAPIADKHPKHQARRHSSPRPLPLTFSSETRRSDFTICLSWSRRPKPATAYDSPGDEAGCRPGSSHDARTLFQRGWANKALGCLDQAAADFEAARLLEPLHPHLSVDYRNIFDTELVVIDDIEPLTQAPALFHSW